MGTTKETQDPLRTGAAPWQDKAALAAGQWSGPLTLSHEGVDLTKAVEYAMVDAVNRRYLEAARGQTNPADAG